MSLDGFVAELDDGVPHIFDWYGSGPVRFDWPGNDMVSNVMPASAAHLSDLVEQTGALVVGRRVFDYTDGWAGRHPIGVPVFVALVCWTRSESNWHRSSWARAYLSSPTSRTLR